MNRIRHIATAFIFILSGLIFSIGTISCANKSIPSTDREWSRFMQNQDLIWDTIPKSWDKAPFMGNGELGLMIYQDSSQNSLRLETGSNRVHDHRTDHTLLGFSRLLTGHFNLFTKGTITDFKARLSLWNAETTIHAITTKGAVDITAFVHASKNLICINVKCSGEESCDCEWVPADADSPRYQYSKLPEGEWMRSTIHEYQSNPKPTTYERNGSELVIQHLLNGGETAICWRKNTTRDGFELRTTISHSYPTETAAEEAVGEIEKSLNERFDKLQKSHREWWHEYYPKSFLSLSDDGKEKFYWIQMYKYASATRGDRPMIDNCGPWLTVTPWPGTWWNLNVQLSYWALNASNHLDLAASLENALYNNTRNLRNNISRQFQEDSYGIGRSSDIDCISDEVKIPNIDDNPEIGCLTWACHNLWLIYRHQMDDDKLRNQLFPLLKGAINYYLHFTYKGNDGKWHLPATYSPEYGTTRDCNFDLALLKWGCKTLVWICDRLEINDPIYPMWQDVLDNIVPFPSDENGLRIGADLGYDHSHRHYSHMLCFYPLALKNPIESEKDRSLLEKSLEHWFSMDKALRGYSFTGASSMYAMLGKGDEALRFLNGLFSDFLSPTTMYKESGPVIETPLSAAKCIQDMLLQSWDEKLRIFPAVPSEWKDAIFCNWLAEGAFEISAERRNGSARKIVIKSLAGEPCTVVTDMKNPKFQGPKGMAVKIIGKNTYSINLSKGQTVTIKAS